MQQPSTVWSNSSTPTHYNSVSTWAHTVPSFNPAPWVHPSDPCSSRMAARREQNHGSSSTPKRSLEPCHNSSESYKIHVTEERMAARFREMHISNQYSVPIVDKVPDQPPPQISNLQDLELLLRDSDSDSEGMQKSLVLAPELRKMVEPQKLLSTAVPSKIERPSMAVVLWQPQIIQNPVLNPLIPESGKDFETSTDLNKINQCSDMEAEEQMDT